MGFYQIAWIAALVLVGGYIAIYNRLRRLAVKVDEGRSGIDVALEKRCDLLSEEIEAVKKFLKHEYETYTAVIAARSGAAHAGALSQDDAAAIERAITEQSAKMEEIKANLEKRGSAMGIAPLAAAARGLGGVGAAVNALVEQYPALYSAASMEHFQHSIFDAEEHLQASRRLYNANVSLYNQTIVSFPWLVAARLHGMKAAEFYEVDDKKREFKVNFD